jgi:hypothetical protein
MSSANFILSQKRVLYEIVYSTDAFLKISLTQRNLNIEPTRKLKSAAIRKLPIKLSQIILESKACPPVSNKRGRQTEFLSKNKKFNRMNLLFI